MSSNAEFSFKVLINKQKTKVLFAEANNDFVDVLISFLTLPLGRIVQVLEKHCGDKSPVIGSLTTLYKGVVNLDSARFWTDGYKQMLINPRSSFTECRNLKLDINETQPVGYFACENRTCTRSKRNNMSMYYDVVRCDCGKPLTREIPTRINVNDGGAFIVDGASFIISDELLIFPNEAGCSVIQILSKLGIADTDLGEIVNVTFGFNEVINLLKASLFSRTPLTDTILNKGQINYTWPSDPLNLLPKVEKQDDDKNSSKNKIVLKVIVQKSTDKLLFAQADEDFIDSIFGFLTMPLAGCLMDCSSWFPYIDNLYWSLENMIDYNYFKRYCKTRLIESKQAHMYLSKYHTSPPTGTKPPKVYFYQGKCPNSEFMSLSKNFEGPCEEINFYNFQLGLLGSYVKRPGTYMVGDDLSVTPLCVLSSLSSLNALKIPISDVTELVVQVGPEEALSILKASLVSKSALSKGLSHLLMKQPKTEQ